MTFTSPQSERRSISDTHARRARTRAVVPAFAAVLGPALALAGCTFVGGPAEEFDPGGAEEIVIPVAEVAERRIDASDVRRHVEFLASDSRRGRATPGAGLERSAAWLAEEFQRAGLEPEGDPGGYLQYWQFEGAGADSAVLVPNVVGLLPGHDLTRAGEYVVVVAHYDHLGVGQPDETGDSIYNGADDNASGVAALVEVAQAFGALSDPPSRPVLFLAVSGEEQGLLGSRWFARNPTVDLSGAVAVVNMDMVGRNHPDSVGVIGYDRSHLGPLIGEVAAANPELGLSVIRDLVPGQSLFRRSDHFPFAERGIPAVAISSGLHEDYHTPSDEAAHIDHDKVTRVARLVFLTVHRIASEADVRP